MSSQSCYIKLPNSDFPIYERIHFWIFKTLFFWSLLLTWNPTFHWNFTATLLDLGVSSVIIGSLLVCSLLKHPHIYIQTYIHTHIHLFSTFPWYQKVFRPQRQDHVLAESSPGVKLPEFEIYLFNFWQVIFLVSVFSSIKWGTDCTQGCCEE